MRLMEMRLNKILLGLGLSLSAITANAAIISGTGLQSGLDAITEDGSFQNVHTSQIGEDEVWQITASGGTISTLVFEFAGFASTTSFGIYDIFDTSKRLEIFDGSAATGSITATVGAGSTTFTSVDLTGGGGILGTETFSTVNFGYYLDSSAGGPGGGLFFSQAALNTDVADAAHGHTTDHMVAYAGDDSDKLDIFGTGSFATFAQDEYILAWEDLTFPGSDYDYSDMVVLVESVIPVPESAPLLTMGLGLLGFGLIRRRRYQQS